MSTDDLIIGLYIQVDAVLASVPKQPQAELSPSELVTLGLLFALRGDGPRRLAQRAPRWLSPTDRAWCPRLPERTRLFRLLTVHAHWTEYFVAQPTLLGVADTYGIELRHPWRADRADRQIGGTGLANHRWIVGAKLGSVRTPYGLVVAWAYACATVAATAFHALIRDVEEEMVIRTDRAFHRAAGDPPKLKPCNRGTWNVRMGVETVLSLLTTVCRLKKVSHRTWRGVKARLAYTMALFNILMMWDGIPADDDNVLHISIAEFVV